MRGGIEPISKTNTLKSGDLTLMTDPEHVVVVTGVNEHDQVSQFIASQTGSSPAIVNLLGYWSKPLNKNRNSIYL